MEIKIKEHICHCGRKSKVYKECPQCRSKKYAQKSADRKNKLADKEDKSDISEYYNYHIENIKKTNAKCEECGVILFKPDTWNVCHIIPKGVFNSVRSVKENCIYLCRQHHAEFDMTFESAKKMKVWATAINRFKQFAHLVKETHKYLNNFQ